MVMDEHQSAKMIGWLDEERRKDKVLIQSLERDNTAQQSVIDDLVRRVQQFESELNMLREVAVNEVAVKQQFDGMRGELLGMVERNEEARKKNDRETKKQRDVEREGMTKALESMRQELLARFERDLGPRRAFEDRINMLSTEVEESAKALFREAEDGQRQVDFLEEQRRIDTRRIAELQEEMLEVQKRSDSLTAKLDLVEELARRNERIGGDISTLREEQQAWAEEQALSGQQRERLLTAMQERLEDFEKRMEGYTQQVEGWGETHSRMKKYLDEADRFSERVERRINEVSEMSRLSEERFRQEWESFIQEDHKRWRQFTLTASEAWREHDRRAEEDNRRLQTMSEMAEQHQKMLRQMISLERQYANTMMDHLQITLDELKEDGAK